MRVMKKDALAKPGIPGWVMALLAVALALAGLSVFMSAQAQGTAYLSYQPNPASINGCGTTTVDVWINDIVKAYAADVEMQFDPTALEVVDAMPFQSGVQIQPLYTFMDAGYTLRNVVTNTTGAIWYAFTQLYPSVGKTGSGPIARITFRAKKAGPTTLSFRRTLWANETTEAITPTFTTSIVNVADPPAPTLAITKTNATDARLTWGTTSGAVSYSLYRDITPYFTPSDATKIYEGNLVQYNDLGILGDVNVQHYYTLRANCETGLQSGNTIRVGEYDWALRSAASSNMNDVSWVFRNPSVNKASLLRAMIGSSVTQISRYDSSAQSFSTYTFPSPLNDFTLTTGMFLFIRTTNTAPAYFTMVGIVPDPNTVNFGMVGSATGKNNYLSLPLDKPNLNSANKVYLSIGSSVLKIYKFDASSQSYSTYTPPSPLNSFPLVIGEPFIIISSASTPPVWP